MIEWLTAGWESVIISLILALEFIEDYYTVIVPILTVAFGGVVAYSTWVYASLTKELVSETRKLRKAQTEPKVVAFVEIMEDAPTIVRLYIKNIGLGPAFDVNFELKADPENEGGNLLIKDFSRAKYLIEGLDYIGPNQKLRSSFTTYVGNSDGKNKERMGGMFVIKIEYKSVAKKYCDSYTIDLSQFYGVSTFTPPVKTITESLKKIQVDIHRIVSSGKLQVDSYTSEDREKKRKEEEKWLQEVQKQREQKRKK